MLFQQKGGLKQATGDEVGLELNPRFFLGLLRALIAGDVINGMGYRLRPFEVEAGATDRALDAIKRDVFDALVEKRSVLRALLRGRRALRAIRCDWTRPAPRVSIIGEFWAMTTEGDGNYQLQRFLESEGAECDIQFVTNWLLFMLWEGRYDTKLRGELRGLDQARKSLKDSEIGKKLFGLFVADLLIRAAFHAFGAAIGFHGYKLPDMDVIAEAAHAHYNNNVRGGEGHMEVGKFILNVLHNKSHMTLSVKPFGCMPSSGVSDGVQSLLTSKYPREHLLRHRDLGRRQGQRAEPGADVPLQGPPGGPEGVRRPARSLRPDPRAGARPSSPGTPPSPAPCAARPTPPPGTAADRLAEVAPLLGKSTLEVQLIRARVAAGAGGRRPARGPRLAGPDEEEAAPARTRPGGPGPRGVAGRPARAVAQPPRSAGTACGARSWKTPSAPPDRRAGPPPSVRPPPDIDRPVSDEPDFRDIPSVVCRRFGLTVGTCKAGAPPSSPSPCRWPRPGGAAGRGPSRPRGRRLLPRRPPRLPAIVRGPC